MSTAFDKLQRFQFSGVNFPVESYEVIGSLRDKVHEYSHADGGDPEILGRKLMMVRAKALFHRTFVQYPGLYPGSLNLLWEKFEDKKIDNLVIPTMGTIRAYCTNWSRKFVARIRSGEAVDLEFREAQPHGKLVFEVTQLASRMSLEPLETEAAKRPNLFQQITSMIDRIQEGLNGVTAVLDQAELYGNLVEAKVLQLKRALEELNRFDGLNEPENYPVYDELQELRRAVIDVQNNLQDNEAGLEEFITDMTMPIQQVSVAIYGTTERAQDLLSLNSIADKLAVPAGTTIRYYPDT